MRLVFAAAILLATATSAAGLAQNGRGSFAVGSVVLGAVMLWATRAISQQRLIVGLLSMVAFALVLALCSPYAFPETTLVGLVGAALVMSVMTGQGHQAYVTVPLIGAVAVGVVAPELAGVALCVVLISVGILQIYPRARETKST